MNFSRMYSVLLILIGLGSSLTPPSLDFTDICDHELISNSKECESVRALRHTVPLLSDLYEKMKVHAREGSAEHAIELSPMDGVLLDSHIASFINGDESQILYMEKLASSCSIEFLKAVFQRFQDRLVSDARAPLLRLLEEKDKKVSGYLSILSGQLRIASQQLIGLRQRIEERQGLEALHERRFRSLEKIMRNYRDSASSERDSYHPCNSMYKRLLESKFDELMVCEPDQIESHVREVLSFLITLPQRGVSKLGVGSFVETPSNASVPPRKCCCQRPPTS